MFGKELTMQNTRVYAGINLSAVLHNLEEMHKNINKNTQIVAVIKPRQLMFPRCHLLTRVSGRSPAICFSRTYSHELSLFN